MKLLKRIRFLPDAPIWTMGCFGGHIRFAKFRSIAGRNFELAEDFTCGLNEAELIVRTYFLKQQPVAILDQSLIGFVSRDSQTPSGTRVEDWIEHSVEDIGYELHVSIHNGHSRTCIGKWSTMFQCISRLESATSILPRCLDWSRMDAEGVVVDAHAHDTDIFLFAESKVLAYSRFAQGIDDSGYEASLQEFLRRWWGELVPMASIGTIYLWTNSWQPTQFQTLCAPVFPWMEQWNSETRLLSKMAMDEVQKGVNTQEGYGSYQSEIWIRRYRWLSWENNIRRWVITPVLILWIVAGLLWFGKQFYSFQHRDQIAYAMAQAQANNEVDSLRNSVKDEQGKMNDWISRKSNSVKAIVTISGHLPAKAWLVSWNTQAKIHSMKGFADTPQEVGQFVENMERSGQFSNVRLRTTEKTKLDGKPVIGFEIEVEAP